MRRSVYTDKKGPAESSDTYQCPQCTVERNKVDYSMVYYCEIKIFLYTYMDVFIL